VKITADQLISEAAGSKYDLIALPGGMPGAEHLRDSAELNQLLAQQQQAGGMYAAICATPAVFLEAKGMLQGKISKDSKAAARNVLLKEPKSREVNDDDVFTVNDNFTSKTVKVKLMAVSSTKEGEQEQTDTRAKVNEDRQPQIDAAIVRIMKARKQLDHNAIITEVTRQLAPRFLPSPPDIKKRIEKLIEREFLERDAEDRKKYIYLA